MKILSGAHRPDSGAMELGGRAYSPEDPQDARRKGVAMIYQELNSGAALDGPGEHPPRRRVRPLRPDRPPCLPRTRPGGARPTRRTPGCRSNAGGGIYDRRAAGDRDRPRPPDPAAGPDHGRTHEQPDFGRHRAAVRVILRLRAQGVSIIYISHFLEECRRVADRYTVLKDGRTVGAGPMPGADLGHIVTLMTGREVKDLYPRRAHSPGPVRIEVNAAARAPRLRPRRACASMPAKFSAWPVSSARAARSSCARFLPSIRSIPVKSASPARRPARPRPAGDGATASAS